MKEPTRSLLAAVLAAALALPAAAAPAALTADLSVSSATVKPAPLVYSFGYRRPAGPRERGSVGVSGGLAEGPPLEMAYWGGSGAVVGAIAGPFGAAVGAAAGAVVGLLVSAFAAPRAESKTAR